MSLLGKTDFWLQLIIVVQWELGISGGRTLKMGLGLLPLNLANILHEKVKTLKDNLTWAVGEECSRDRLS